LGASFAAGLGASGSGAGAQVPSAATKSSGPTGLLSFISGFVFENRFQSGLPKSIGRENQPASAEKTFVPPHPARASATAESSIKRKLLANFPKPITTLAEAPRPLNRILRHDDGGEQA
jgi:hypothetical protein